MRKQLLLSFPMHIRVTLNIVRDEQTSVISSETITTQLNPHNNHKNPDITRTKSMYFPRKKKKDLRTSF